MREHCCVPGAYGAFFAWPVVFFSLVVVISGFSCSTECERSRERERERERKIVQRVREGHRYEAAEEKPTPLLRMSSVLGLIGSLVVVACEPSASSRVVWCSVSLCRCRGRASRERVASRDLREEEEEEALAAQCRGLSCACGCQQHGFLRVVV